jgi:serine/threonine-protein kinase
LTEPITDEAHVLRPAEHALVEGALKKLQDGRGTKLWVVYVKNFGDLMPVQWAEHTMHANGFTDHDAMLAIATDRRSFAFEVPPAVIIGTQINVQEIHRERIKPAVDRREWTKAAIAAANGLDVGPR